MVINEELTGRVIAGKYRLDALIGKGGFGQVYSGEHLAMSRKVAIKVISINHPKVQAQDGVERFSREARVISQLQSPHTVSVFDYGVESSMLYLVMEHIEGETLKALVKRERGLRPERAARLAVQILRSLEEAHHRGILHRDLKPANVMVFRDFRGEEQIKVLDFGIAKVLNPARARAMGELDLTEDQGFVGTPRYAAPEQLFGQRLSAVTDLYGVGMLLWEMLVGRPALEARTWGECTSFHIDHQDQPMRMPAALGIPSTLTHITERAVMRFARDRWESAAQMREALEAWIENPESVVKSPSSTMPSLDEAFWASSSKTIDPNLSASQQFYGGETGHVDIFGEDEDHLHSLALAPKPLRRPERAPKISTLEQADWAQSAAHIPLADEGLRPTARQVQSASPRDAAPATAASSSSETMVASRAVEERRERRRDASTARGTWVLAGLGVLGAVILGGVALSFLVGGEEVEVPAVSEVFDEERASFEVPDGRFSSEGIWLAVQAAHWRRVSSMETIDLRDVRQYTAFYERGRVTCEVTLVEARSEMALHELLTSAGSEVSVVRFDYRAIKLSPIKGEGMHEEVASLTRHLKNYRKLVIEEHERERSGGKSP